MTKPYFFPFYSIVEEHGGAVAPPPMAPMNQGPETTGAIVKRLSCSILGSLSINRNKYNVNSL